MSVANRLVSFVSATTLPWEGHIPQWHALSFYLEQSQGWRLEPQVAKWEWWRAIDFGLPQFSRKLFSRRNRKKIKLINCLQECKEWNNQLLTVTLFLHHQVLHNKITWIGHKLRRSPPLPTNPIPMDLNDLERLGDAIGASGVMPLTSNAQKWSPPVASTSLSRWYGHPYASSCQHVIGWTFCC